MRDEIEDKKKKKKLFVQIKWTSSASAMNIQWMNNDEELTFGFSILIVDFVQFCIVLRCVAAFWGNIHDDEHMTFIFLQAHGLAFDIVDGEFIDWLSSFWISLVSWARHYTERKKNSSINWMKNFRFEFQWECPPVQHVEVINLRTYNIS